MNISLAWLNSMLAPGDVSADEAEHVLTFVGFPIESATKLPGGDTLLDVEVTSNRGDCLSHVGVAREIAAVTGRQLKLPHSHTATDPAETGKARLDNYVSLENRVAGEMGVGGGGGCPLFTLRVISGVQVGPSPKWMVERLEAVGQRSINNVVDCTNYVLFELGSPSHVFDMARMRPDGGWAGNTGLGGKPAVIVRGARAGEKLTLLDGKTVELKAGELVVADGERASSLAGIMGGAESAVSQHTTDVLVEVATWSPGPIRAAARRLNLRTDASHRFERRVDPRTVEAASRRVAELIVQTAGGTLMGGVLAAGAPLPASPSIAFRPRRARAVLGANFSDDQMRTALTAQGVAISSGSGESWSSVAPAHRPDIRIEEDLIEEVARTIGLDKIPVSEKFAVRVASPQQSELAAREMSRVLTGLGFFETVTFSFVSEKHAKPFTPKADQKSGRPGWSLLAVSDERRKGEGTLRSSLLPSLLQCRRANQNAKAAPDGTVRLFEIAPVYGQVPPGTPLRHPAGHAEYVNLSLIADVPPAAQGATGGAAARRQAAIRLMRGVVEQLADALVGTAAKLEVVPAPMPFEGFDPAASAEIRLNGQPLGVLGLVSDATQRLFELETPVVAAVLFAPRLLATYPPRATVHALPAFPAVERDLSLVVDESLPWAKVEATLASAKPRWMEELRFVYTYRGKPLAEGKKSVTLRMVFREQDRTLRDDEVNAEMERVIAHARRELGAVVRT